MIKLKDILKEDEVTDTFGKVAFGSVEKIARLQGRRYEDDTEAEEKILDTLIDWVNEPGGTVANKLYKNFSLFKKAAKKFPNIFLPNTSNGTTLYRGLHSPSQELIRTIKKTKRVDWKKEGQMMVYTKPIKYKPRKKVQSWTTDVYVIKGEDAFGGGKYILTTEQTDEFLFNQNVVKILFGQNEKEVLHFGQNYKEKVYLMMDNWDYGFFFDE